MAFTTTATIASFGGKLLKLTHEAKSTNCKMALNLYLPPQAFSAQKMTQKVPVLFYLSGLTCTGDNCSEKGFFQHKASEKGIAVVYPDTSPRKNPTFSLFSAFVHRVLSHLTTRAMANRRFRDSQVVLVSRAKTMRMISAAAPVSTSMRPRRLTTRATTCTPTSRKSCLRHFSRTSRFWTAAGSALLVTAWVATVL